MPATVEFFYAHPLMADGTLNKCKSCVKEYAAAKRKANPEAKKRRDRSYYLKNRDRAREYGAARYRDNKALILGRNKRWVERNRDRVKAYARQQYAVNPSRVRQNYRRYYERNREAILARSKEKRHANLDASRERGREIASRRRARKLSATGTHTRAEFIALGEFYGWRCVYCDAQMTRSSATEDHVIPLSRGGSDSIENIVPACAPCNKRKSWKLPHEFIGASL